MKLLKVGAIAAALALGACQNIPMATMTASQTLEQADTASSLAYAAIATVCNDVAAASPSKAQAAIALETQAWGILQQERALYAQGQDVTALLDQLQTLETQAKAL